jgi:hypothetical protein
METLVAKGALDKADMTKVLSAAVRNLGDGSEAAQLVSRIMERVDRH